MRNFQRFYILALSLALVMGSLLTFVQPAAAAVELKDLAECSDYARPAVERLVAQEVISGDENNYFNPKTAVTRGEIITIIVRALDIEALNLPDTASFKDVPKGHWANNYVETAYARGIVKGVSSDRFGVNQKCTREEMATMFVRSFNILDESGSKLALPTVDMTTYTDNQAVSTWAKDTVGFALYSGLLFGTSATTLSPQAMAVREQAAVLIDRFLARYDTIKSDRQATALLNQAQNNLANTMMLSNHSTSSSQFTLWAPLTDLPQKFAVTTDTVNQAIWPNLMHSITKMEMPGLPQDEYPPYSFEQYLADRIVYEKVIDGNTTAGWERYSPLNETEASEIMGIAKENLTALLDPGLLAHQTGKCTVDEAVVNGAPGYKITYTGSITDLRSYLLNVLPKLIPQDTSSPQNWLEDLVAAVTAASYTQTYYIGVSDGKLWSTNLKVQIDCRQTNSNDTMPIKTMIIDAATDNYQYDGVSMTLPEEARSAPEK